MLYSYATNGMNFQVGDVFIGYVANGKIVRSPNSENGSWLRRSDINLVQGGKLTHLNLVSHKRDNGSQCRPMIRRGSMWNLHCLH